MIELVCQTLDLLARLYLPAIEFGDLADQHVVGRLDRLPWHVDRPRQPQSDVVSSAPRSASRSPAITRSNSADSSGERS